MATKPPNSIADANERQSVSTNSPQSPTARTLLEPITLDFDPMSFELKEESPLTSPSDSNRCLGLSPSENAEIIDFFDPFCPVKEESPTDYYPNVVIGQPNLSEQLSPNEFSNYDMQSNLVDPMEIQNEDIDVEFQGHIDTDINRRIESDDAFINPIDVSLDEGPVDQDIDHSHEDIDHSHEDIDHSHEDIDHSHEEIDHSHEEIDHSHEDIDNSHGSIENDLANDFIENRLDDLNNEDSTMIDTFGSDEMPVESYTDLGNSSNCSPAHTSKSDITTDVDLLTKIELTQNEDTSESLLSEKVLNDFDDNKHDINSQHDESDEDDLSRKSRTSSTQSIKSDRSEKKSSFKSSEISYKDDIKKTLISSKEAQKEILSKKTSVEKIEKNGYASHNGVNTVNLKNSKNSEFTKSEKIDGLSSVTDLKSSLTKNTEESQQNAVEEVKPSVDRVKVQRTFSQTGQDELCLCKNCGKHVYQMEKLKAERSIFHKNCFRCKECNKLLNVDSYSSNEGDIYCKPHFRQLFQPKARFDGEDGAPRKQRRNEMIIRENVPAELPPDVVRSDSKPDHGLESLPVNLSSIKSKFEAYREEHHLPSTTDVCTLQRSASVMARLAKYQSAVSGGDAENGDLSESENDEECTEDTTVIKPSKHKEKVVFSGMSNLKSQWETGSMTASKEEHIEEKKEELNKLRQRICLGRSESMKAVYEKACQDTSKQGANRNEPVELGREVKATRIKERFEKGELVNEVEEENLEKFRKEKEEDLSVFTEPGIANDAKKLFKQIDAAVKTTPISITKSPVKSPSYDRHLNMQSPSKDADVIKCSQPTEKEDIPVDTTDVTQRFKFFENYSDAPKERKRFQITPPREPTKESSPEPELPHDPNIVRAIDTVDDIPTTDTARRMLDKFKALEKETPSLPAGLKPLKRITPPREYTKVDADHDSSPEPERDPNIIQSSYKSDDDIIIEADKAKSLRAKFENWNTELRDGKQNEDDDDEDFLPQVDTTKNLRAKFEAIKEDTLKSTEKPKPKVNRFIQEQATASIDVCSLCGKKVYPMEKMEASGMRIHKNCFRCAHCSCMLRLENYTKSGRNLYCTPHFKQLFISKGNYDEGFGREQHKEKWNRNCNNTVSRDLHENDIELSNGDVQCLEQTV